MRIFEDKKSEYTFRTINSLIKSLKQAETYTKNINYQITVIDAGSSEPDKEIMREKLDRILKEVYKAREVLDD